MIEKVKKCQLRAKTHWLCHFWAPFRSPRASCSGVEVLGRSLSPLCPQTEFSSRRLLAYSTRLPYSALHKPHKSPTPVWFLPPNHGFLLHRPSRCVLWDLCSSIFEPPSGTCLKPAFFPGQQFPFLPPSHREAGVGFPSYTHHRGWPNLASSSLLSLITFCPLWPTSSVTMPSIPLLPPAPMTTPRKSPLCYPNRCQLHSPIFLSLRSQSPQDPWTSDSAVFFLHLSLAHFAFLPAAEPQCHLTRFPSTPCPPSLLPASLNPLGSHLTVDGRRYTRLSVPWHSDFKGSYLTGASHVA